MKNNSKLTKLFNVCWNHVLFILFRSSYFQQMLNNFVNFELLFCNEITFKKKSSDRNHEALCIFVNFYFGGALFEFKYSRPAIWPTNAARSQTIKRKEIVRWGLALAEPKNHARNWAQSELFSQPPIGLFWAAETSGSVSVNFHDQLKINDQCYS